MNTLRVFFGEFWGIFIGVAIGASCVWLARRLASNGYLPFIGPKFFPELSAFGKKDQRRLLHKASAIAFRHWESFVPIPVFAVTFSVGIAVGLTIPKVTTLPDSLWSRVLSGALFAALFGAIASWLASRLTARYLRPFLKECIENASHVA